MKTLAPATANTQAPRDQQRGQPPRLLARPRLPPDRGREGSAPSTSRRRGAGPRPGSTRRTSTTTSRRTPARPERPIKPRTPSARRRKPRQGSRTTRKASYR
ncbi:hypothetical protein G5V59_02760 [Nocardioides sp. W3-2-3]|uniref:hypothetical protein n=1 Tax=Nocardioides convexus TaxID=2712224 RepID=UPI00241851D7|nr:hypothetical protein [Nocardioides convexus]NGZ99672.1 hypothetical protein [Nocardioides convexus]